MKPASITELKYELKQLSQAQLIELCLRLAKYKLENKELLHYLLFEAQDEDAFVRQVEAILERQFKEIPKMSNQYLLKKSLRKILRFLNKQIKSISVRQRLRGSNHDPSRQKCCSRLCNTGASDIA